MRKFLILALVAVCIVAAILFTGCKTGLFGINDRETPADNSLGETGNERGSDNTFTNGDDWTPLF